MDEHEAWLAALRECAAASRDESLLQAGWNAYATWLLMDPARIPVDKLVPDWDSLTRSQQIVIEDMYRVTEFRSTDIWTTEAFRKAFETMLGRILTRVTVMTNSLEEKKG